ncbi:Atu4866 domain-containing protein [Actinomadura sp. HBU206391]|uniref:Atu4866 domain-containing protein n=1 Tax=Actinomadura sp. HBU206391 TaxID=2731692 RepID=UPI00164F8B9F|nr:Atu4866 domain-containing protein [Actinomadura sp. HBU206391]MBC6462352.1 Atu4866 domain-containing protein [Actinomadura sp. HBU206391]
MTMISRNRRGDRAVHRPEHPYLGTWVTTDRRIRQDLLPGGRYDEARGARRSACRGSYTIDGDQIEYVDDAGYMASGVFHGDMLYHGGYVFHREA